MRPLRLVAAVALVVGAWALAGACASAPLKPLDLKDLAAADQQILNGCYDCLVEAHTTYARLGVGKARPLIVTRLFEVDLLLTLRQKELAITPAPYRAEAETLVPELAPTLDAPRILRDVDNVLPDDIGTPRTTLMILNGTRAVQVGALDTEAAWLAAVPLRTPVSRYISIAVDCYSRGMPRHEGMPELTPDAPPLVQYRAAICGTPYDPVLRGVRTQVPGFVETSYFLARRAVAAASRSGPAEARALLTEAYAHFPQSASVTYLDGNLEQTAGNCRTALARFDETLAMQPAHEDAMLGRTECLSYLARHDEAIAEATHMLEVRVRAVDAYYWRAWNWRELKELAKARTDIEAAKANSVRADVYRLAGMIEHDQDDLDPAEADLRMAIRIPDNQGDCVARWYLGLVYMKKTRWVDSGAAFEDTYHCYQGKVGIDQDELDKMRRRTDLDKDFQASQIAGFEEALTEDRSQTYASAFNAANHYARGGELAKARPLLDVAAEDPTLADQVKALRTIVKTPAVSGRVPSSP